MTSKFHLLLGGDRPPRPLPVTGTFTLGSAASCDLVLSGDDVDAEHARLECSASGVRLIDLASSTGTRVNGSLVSRVELNPGDRLTVGSHLLGFVPAAGTAAGAATRPARSTPPRPRVPGPKARPVTVPTRPAPSPTRDATPRPGPAPGIERGAPAPRRARRSGPSTALILGGVGLAAVVLVVLFAVTGSSDEEPLEARQTYRRAVDLLAANDVEGAERLLEEIETRWPDTESGRDAALKRQGIRQDREREERARTEIEKAWAARNALAPAALDKRFANLAARFGTTRAFREFAPIEARLEEHYGQVRREAFDAARRESDEALAKNGYAAALVAWREYFRLGDQIPKSRVEAQEQIDRILAAAEEVYLEAVHEAEALTDEARFDEALARLEKAERRLVGTRFAAAMRLTGEAVVAARAASRGEAAPAVAENTEERRAALESLQEAELLASARRYEEAAAAYRAHLEQEKDPRLRGDVAGRLAELVDLAFLMKELRRQIAEAPDRFLGITLGGSIKGRATEADEDGFVLLLTGGRSRLMWRRLDDRRWYGLLLRMKLDGEGLAALARFCFLAGFEGEGHATLAAASEAGATAERVDAILARLRRLDVPDGGFVLYGKRWYTPAERDAVALRDRIEDLARKAGSSDRRRAETAIEELRGLGETARPALIAALTAVREELRQKLFSLAAGNPGLVASLVRELKAAREHALSLIHDAKRYPYNRGSADPYGPNGAEVQRDVDERVKKVRDIWEDPLGHVAERWPDLAELLERLRAVDDEVAGLSGTEARLPGYLREARDRIGLAAVADGKTHQKSLEVVAANALKVDAVDVEERNCVLAVNEYRMMMGLRAVVINTALVAASRQHSGEMAELNYFAHESPVPENRSPGHRARNAEYKGGGVSENIARGATTGRDAHNQWCHSSGHHRNVLGRGHTEIGVGLAQGSWWTQMFGRGSGK